MTPSPTRSSYSKLGVAQLSDVNDRQKQAFARHVLESGGQDFIDTRMQAYLFRWREALAFAQNGADILDIGGGYITDEIFSVIADQHRLNYSIVDIDRNVINEARRKLGRSGMRPEQAMVSDNSQIPFDGASFDFIFSSHCLEHSVNLTHTFSEIRRVLRENGTLFMSVPFGFDEPVEHNYYLGIEEWVALVDAAGFQVLNVNVGRNYVQFGWDLSICARVSRPLSTARINAIASTYCKSAKTLIHHSDEIFEFRQPDVIRTHGACMRGVGSSCLVNISEKLSALLIYRNAWAGTLRVAAGNAVQYVNAYSGVDWLSAVDVSHMSGPLEVTIVGGHPLAHDVQGGIFGVLTAAI